jgi:hypothetical protein
MKQLHRYPDYLNADGSISLRRIRITALRGAKFDRDVEVCRAAGLSVPLETPFPHNDAYAALARTVDRSKVTLKPFKVHLRRRLKDAILNARLAHNVVVKAPAREKELDPVERQAQHHELRADFLDSALPPRKDEAEAERQTAKRIREQAAASSPLAPVMPQAERVRA